MGNVSFGLLGLVLISAAALFQTGAAPRSELAPTGTMRVAVNLGNPLLVTADAQGGQPRGVAVDLAMELGKRAGLPVKVVGYASAGTIAAEATKGTWDIAFMGAEPERAADVVFSDAYLEIEAGYLVRRDSPFRTVDDVDRAGVSVAVSEKSVYDLYLSRSLKHARLIRANGYEGAYKRFIDDKLDVVAGLKPVMLETETGSQGFRVLDGRFTVIRQAIGIPKGREAGARYLETFSSEIRSSGLLAGLVKKHGIRGVAIPSIVRQR